MQRIVIHHFGPIREIDLPIRELTILIGPNASGKSLVGKLVWFFKQIPDQLFWYVHAPEWAEIKGEEFLRKLLAVELPRLFRDSFGSREFLRPGETKLRFVFDAAGENWIELEATPEFLISVQEISPTLLAEIQQYLKKGQEKLQNNQGDALWNQINRIFGLPEVSRQFRWYLSPLRGSRTLFRELMIKAFVFSAGEPSSTYQNQSSKSNSTLDFWYKKYLNTHLANQVHFQDKDWALLLRQEKKLEPNSETVRRLQVIQKSLAILSEIIQGTYHVSKDGRESIETRSGQQIPMEQAASGQGEVTGMWPAFIESIWRKKPGFFLIEEPEAHLYPTAQQQVVQALALVLNAQAGNQVMINTHSPYVLTAFDNLITAAETAKIGAEQSQQVQQVVEKEFWVDFDRVSAVYIEDGELVTGDEESVQNSILNWERKGLGGSRIDVASEKIGLIFDQLLDIQYPVHND